MKTMTAMSYIPLHSHSSYTTGAFSIKEYLERAKILGFPAVALTDPLLFGAPEFFILAEQIGIKPILGAEIDSTIILVENAAGYKNLSKIVTRNCLEQATLQFIADHSQGLIFISADNNNLRFLRSTGVPMADLFINVNPTSRYPTSYFSPAATNEVLYLEKSDHQFHSVVNAIRQASFVQNSHPGFNYLLKSSEMSALFNHIPEALENTCAIGQRCNFTLKKTRYHFPENDHRLLLELLQPTWNRLDRQMKQRLSYELKVIEKTSFAGLFIAAYRIGQFTREKAITINVRGSGIASLTLHLLGLSIINPLRFNLPFERFLNYARAEPPDIDIDVEFHRRDEVLDFLCGKYGKDKTAQIATINHFRLRSAFRSAALAFGISPEELKNIKLHNQERLLNKIREYADRLTSLPNHVSVHIGGVVITPSRIDEFAPLYQSDQGIITHYDKDGIDYIGLVKFDILGVRGLPTIAHLVHQVPDEATDVFELIGQGKTMGCFQIESPPMRSLLVKMKPKRIEDIALALALIRPGATNSGMKEQYLQHYMKGEPVDYFPASLRHILQDTGGVPVYQEQILEIAGIFAGFTLAQADELRRAMTKARGLERINALRDKFIEGAYARGHSNADVERVWGKIQDFANFGFNKAHSADYGTLAYLSAHAKKHTPVEFFASVLSNHGGYYATAAYVEEARRWGIKILPPDVNSSQAAFHPADGGIITGLAEIKNLSARTIRNIVDQRPFRSAAEFFDRARPDIEEGISLIKAGALDSFGLAPPAQFLLLLSYLKNRKHAAQHKLVEQESLIRQLELASRSYDTRQAFLDQYATLNLSPNFHPLKLLKPGRNFFINDIKENVPVSFWGNVIVRRVIESKNNKLMAFISLDDETGVVEAVLFPDVYRKYKNLLGPILHLAGTHHDGTFIVERILAD